MYRKRMQNDIFLFLLIISLSFIFIQTVEASTGDIFYVTSDTHIGTSSSNCDSTPTVCTNYSPKILNKTVFSDLVNTTKVKSNIRRFMLVVGDITQNGTVNQINNYLDVVGTANNDKIFSSLGNHDLRQSLKENATNEDYQSAYLEHRTAFINAFGSISNSWNIGSDSDKIKVIRIGTDFSNSPVTPWDASSFGYGYLSTASKKFLENELSSAMTNNQVAIVMSHWPVYSTVCSSNSGYRMTTDNSKVDESFNKIISKYPNAIIVSGHTHGRFSKCPNWYYIGDENNSDVNTSHSMYVHDGTGIKGTYADNDSESPTTDFLKITIKDQKSVEISQQYFDTENKNITAGSKINWSWYKVSYNCNGGSESVANTYRYQKASSNSCTKTGYSFLEWNTKKNGTGTSYKPSAIVDNGAVDSVLYAQWQANTYSVTLNQQNGKDGTSSITATYGSAMPTITKPTRSYQITYNYNGNGSENTIGTATYIFGGYYTSTGGSGTNYYTKEGVSAKNWDKTSATTLYAKWTTASLVLPTATRDGYTFTGWYDAQSGGNKIGIGGENYTPTENKTLYAHWKKETAFAIHHYDIDDSHNYLRSIELKTDLSTYKNYFTLPEGYTLSINLGNKKYIYTGSKVKIYLNNEEIESYTNVVKGDMNGDGEVNSGDLLKIRQHLIGSNELKDIYFTAGDINNDSVLNSGDLLRVRQHLIGIKTIS